MIRISKIFKRHGETPESLPKGIKPEGSQPEGDHLHADETHHHHDSRIKISSALNKELERERPSTPTIAHLYDNLIIKARDIYTVDQAARINFSSELNPLIDKIADSLIGGNDELLLTCLRNYPRPEDTLYYHVVNVVVISIAIGFDLEYERNKLLELGVAAFAHDIGVKGLDFINKPDIFSDEDFDKVKRHPDEGALVLSRLDSGLSQRVLDAVRQEHERTDGSGYPKGLVADEITEYAQIIGLADVYEALMHERSYRPRYSSIDTIRIILKNKKVFSKKVVKALIEAFGIFPVETLVQLNTKEIGVVVKRNLDLISRPVLDVIIDSSGKEMKQPKRINLADNPVIYIDTCIKQEVMTANA